MKIRQSVPCRSTPTLASPSWYAVEGSLPRPGASAVGLAARGGLIVIVAVAGRRIDAPDAAVARFPLPNRRLLARRIGAALCRLDATARVGPPARRAAPL